MPSQNRELLKTLTGSLLNLDTQNLPDKRVPLSDAIAKLVRPKMSIHILTTHSRSGAGVYELCRQFRGKDPQFTVSSLGIVSTVLTLVHLGLAKKLVATFTGDAYPTPAPNPIIQRGLDENKIEIENWTILTFPLRFLAGAFGIPYLPVRSLVGSDMAKENQEWFETEPGSEFGKLKAYRPDLAIVHAIAADQSGNAILTAPYGEDAFGAWAAKEGIILTCERIVAPELIRRYSHLVKIPGSMVKAVCEVPFGAHPGGVSNQGIKELDAYADDYDFLEELRLASKSKEQMDQWCDKYVFSWKSWEGYLDTIGKTRLWSLKGKADQDSWHSELIELWEKIDFAARPGPMEWMIAVAARKIAERIQAQNYQTILAGVGASNLAAWLGYYKLRELKTEVQLIAEIGFYGYQPRPADPFIFNYRNIPTCKMLSGIETVMGIFMGGAAAQCIGVIGAGQLDRFGNINSTKIGKTFLVGSGGANDICSSAREVLVTAIQDKSRFVPNVSYITSPGKRVKTIVSNFGVLTKQGDQLALSGYFDYGKPEDQAVEEIKANCGWDLKVSDQLEKILAPAPDELNLIRLFDPKRQFLGKK